MPYSRNYPDTVAEVLREGKKYKADTLRAVKNLRRSKAWRGTLEEQQEKIKTLHQELCSIYNLRTVLEFIGHNGTEEDSGSSRFDSSIDKIYLSGRISVVTYLHEFAHARGMDERKACIWSINLFRRIFPNSYARCTHDSHMLRRAS